MTQAGRVGGLTLTDEQAVHLTPPLSPPPLPQHFIRTHLLHLALGPCPRKIQAPLPGYEGPITRCLSGLA